MQKTICFPLQNLFEQQKKLNNAVYQTFKINYALEKEILLEKQILSFIVELSELANETKCFKYWTKKPYSNIKKIGDEYADGMHFLLTIGLYLSWNIKELEVSILNKELTNNELVKEFNQIMILSIDYLKNFHDHDRYLKLFQAYLQLAFYLGMNKESIYQSYQSKNYINLLRLKSNY